MFIIYFIDHFFILGHAPILCSWRQFETVVSKVVSWNHLNSHKYKNKSNIMLHKFLVHITKIPSWVFKCDKLFFLKFEIYKINMTWLSNSFWSCLGVSIRRWFKRLNLNHFVWYALFASYSSRSKYVDITHRWSRKLKSVWTIYLKFGKLHSRVHGRSSFLVVS